uniref:C-type lectin domain-containing protein n=1 Tax=Salarias fasciatus TaxID=181472 RepID=A0A672GLR2_SALFA
MTWDQNEPSGNQYRPAVACWDCGWDGLHDVWHSALFPFFCVRLEVAAERRLSWERALEHCERQDSALASISSQTEQLLAETEVQQSGVGGPVWIGLRFLVDRWLWVDGSELRFVAWAGIERGDRCPVLKRCGALSEQGLWENRDCAEEHHFICN